MLITHAHNSARTELLNKEVSTHRCTTRLLIQTQEADVLIVVNEIKQKAINRSCLMPETYHKVTFFCVSFIYTNYASQALVA